MEIDQKFSELGAPLNPGDLRTFKKGRGAVVS